MLSFQPFFCDVCSLTYRDEWEKAPDSDFYRLDFYRLDWILNIRSNPNV